MVIHNEVVQIVRVSSLLISALFGRYNDNFRPFKVIDRTNRSMCVCNLTRNQILELLIVNFCAYMIVPLNKYAAHTVVK